MKKEEMAKAYAEGFAKEYREIAYDAFLCGYDAKCSTETPNDLEEAAVDIANNLLAKPKDYALSAKADYWNGAHDGVIAGAKWQEKRNLRFVKQVLSGDFTVFEAGRKYEREQMMKRAVDADIMLTLHDKTGDVSLHTGYLPKELGIKCDDKVRIIIVKEN